MAAKDHISELLGRLGGTAKDLGTAIGGGYGRGATFGLVDPSKNASIMDSGPYNEVGMQMKNHPYAADVGEILTYLTPLLGEEKAAAYIGGKIGIPSLKALLPTSFLTRGAASLGKMGTEKLMKLIGADASKGVAKLATSVMGNSIAGGAQSGAQGAIRSISGDEDISNVPSDIAQGAKIGGVLGAVAPAVGAAGKKIYSHPDIIPPKMTARESAPFVQRMMDEGAWGGRGTFEDVAKNAKDKYTNTVDELTRPMRTMPIDPSAPYKELNEKANIAMRQGKDAEADALRKAAWRGSESLAKNPIFGEVINNLDEINMGNSQLTAAQKEAAASGKISTFNNEDYGAQSAKNSLKNYRDKQIQINQGNEGADRMAQANKDYAYGENIQKGLNQRGSGAGEDLGTPVTPRAVKKATIGAAIAPLPVRTGAGLFLNNISKNNMPGALGGVRAERNNEVGQDPFGDIMKSGKESAPKTPEKKQAAPKQDSDPFADIMSP